MITNAIVTKIAYLMGIQDAILLDPEEPFDQALFNELKKDEKATDIRVLCTIRSKIQRGFKNISCAMRYEGRRIDCLEEYISTEYFKYLKDRGIYINVNTNYLTNVLIEINRCIQERIGLLKPLFPYWVRWDYIYDFFVMPNGLSESGTKAASEVYYNNIEAYPYRVYFNWPRPEKQGNILYDDKCFLINLYKMHGQEFNDYGKVTLQEEKISKGYVEFAERAEKIDILVDCENSDPFHFYSIWKNIFEDNKGKVCKIMLFNDNKASSGWNYLQRYINAPVENILIERIKDEKSLVDIRLSSEACKEYFKNGVRSFVLVSSDSDYWGLMNTIEEADFLIVMQRGKDSCNIRDAYNRRHFFYCYVEDLPEDHYEYMKNEILQFETRKYLKKHFCIDINDICREVFDRVRIAPTEEERCRFMQDFFKTIPKLHFEREEEKIYLSINTARVPRS